MIFIILLQLNYLIFQNLYLIKLNFCVLYFSENHIRFIKLKISSKELSKIKLCKSNIIN